MKKKKKNDRLFWPAYDLDRREGDAMEARHIGYLITGPEQVRPVDIIKELHNIQFKEAFVDFLITHWSSNEMAELVYK